MYSYIVEFVDDDSKPIHLQNVENWIVYANDVEPALKKARKQPSTYTTIRSISCIETDQIWFVD